MDTAMIDSDIGAESVEGCHDIWTDEVGATDDEHSHASPLVLQA
jgi:hypothetical protein